VDALRAPIIIGGFLLLTFLCAPLQWLMLRLGLSARERIPHFYHRLLCKLIGIRIRVVGTPINAGGLMLANHSSWLDIIILSAVTRLSFIAKSEVNGWPLFGFLARLQRTIFVRRGEKRRTISDRDSIRARLLAGEVLVIFPEGTSSDGNRVLPFKSALVSAAELPLGNGQDAFAHFPLVQPVSVAYVGNHGIPMGREVRPHFAWYGDMELLPHLWEAFSSGPLDVVVEFHEAFSAESAGGRKRLAAKAENAVRVGLVRALQGGQSPAASAIAEPANDQLADDEAEAAE